MKTIKFRGVKVTDGEYVYGDLSHDRGHIFINDKRVKPESIDLLVGYDKDDEEIYEGDVLVNDFGETFEAKAEVVFFGKGSYFATDIGATTGLKKSREAPHEKN